MNRKKFFLGGGVILAAIIYLIVSSTQATAQYFLTVDEIFARREEFTEKDVRLSGAVIGDTIQYDPKTLTLSFEIAQVAGDNGEIEKEGGLAHALANACSDPNRRHLKIIYNGPKPDLLRNEAQAILTGKMNDQGEFVAQEVLLKCPTKYEKVLPDQSK
jgi:cytochrome c-type biogenesis protein CcmE